MRLNPQNPAELDALVNALIKQESGGRADAIGPLITAGANAGTRAQGRFQVMPKTAANPGFGIKPANLNDPNDVERVGREYLTAMLNRYDNNVPLALAAYNAGPGNADKLRDSGMDYGVLPDRSQTENYVSSIMSDLGGGGIRNKTTMSSRNLTPEATAQVGTPFVPEERASVIDQLRKGDWRGAGSTFMDNIRGSGVKEGLPEELSNDAARMQQNMVNTNAPVSWAQVLAVGASDLASGMAQNALDEEKSERMAKLSGLLSTGDMSPENLAMIMELDPELGQTLMVNKQERDHDVEMADMQFERQSALQQAEFQHDIALKLMSPDEKTALQQNVAAAGFVPGTPEFQAEIRRQMDPQNAPEVQAAKVANAGNLEFSKKVGGLAGEEAIGLVAAANNSASQLPQLERMTTAVQNFETGLITPMGRQVGALMSSLGLTNDDLSDSARQILEKFNASPDQAASMDEIERVMNESVIGKIGVAGGEGGFPANNFSNADLDFLKQTIPALTDTKAGFLTKLAYFKWREKSTVNKSNAWFEYQKGIQAQGRETTAMDWQEFNNQWRNKPRDAALAEEIYTTMSKRDKGLGIAHVTTDEEYQALPSGTLFRDPEDLQTYRKP